MPRKKRPPPILAVDDDEELLQNLAEFLRNHFGVDVTTSPTVSAALLLLAARGSQFSLVVSDLSVGRENGLKIWRHLLADHWHECPFILFTGSLVPDDVRDNTIVIDKPDFSSLREAARFVMSLR